MKVLVMYETPAEIAAASNLAKVLNTNIGRMLCDATIVGDSLQMPSWQRARYTVEAVYGAYTELPTPKRVIPQQKPPPGVTIRQLDLDEDDD